MFKLDNNFLTSLGLASLPVDEKNKLLQAIYERLEMNVGMRLAERMTDAQLDEFEGFIDRSDEAGALRWLETNFPNYKQVVAEELDKLKNEISQAAPQILAAAQQPNTGSEINTPHAPQQPVSQQFTETPQPQAQAPANYYQQQPAQQMPQNNYDVQPGSQPGPASPNSFSQPLQPYQPANDPYSSQQPAPAPSQAPQSIPPAPANNPQLNQQAAWQQPLPPNPSNAQSDNDQQPPAGPQSQPPAGFPLQPNN